MTMAREKKDINFKQMDVKIIREFKAKCARLGVSMKARLELLMSEDAKK